MRTMFNGIEVVDVAEAAKTAHVTETIIRRLANEGTIASFRMPGIDDLMLKKSDVDEFAENRAALQSELTEILQEARESGLFD